MLPPTPQRPVSDVLHGVEIVDPYRWLEDGTSPDSVTWTAAQNEHARGVLDALPDRVALHSELLTLLDVPTSVAPALAGDWVFSLDRPSGAEQALLVVRPVGSVLGPARTVIDPVAMIGEPTASIDWYEPSHDGALVAFGISTGGDERSTLHLAEVATGSLRSDRIPETRAASVVWDPDSRGFAYTRYPVPGEVPDGEEEYHRTVWWHRVGSDSADDIPVFTDLLDPTAWPTIVGSRDGRWLVVHLSLGWSRTDVVLLDRVAGNRRTIIEGVDAVTQFVVDGDRLLGTTTLGAPRGRVVAASLDDPGQERWLTLVPESATVVESVDTLGDGFVVAGSRTAVSTLTRHDRSGALIEAVELPELATIGGVATDHHGRIAMALSSFGMSSTLYGSTDGGPLDRWSAAPSVGAAGLVVEQVRYPSTDGVLVPMFLVRSEGTVPGPATPTLLTGYGGFSISNGPAYSPLVVAWCRRGGQVAVANIRGGSEEGEDWHQAGMLDRKQQCFDDFFAAADWLVAAERCSHRTLAVRGGSNGGLLMGAVVTQRPELAAAVHCAVPLLDMVRYHRFLIARLWIPEYGDPDDADAFAWLHAYSPYHRVADGTCYPATLITSGEGDSRVDPMHARKMAARLQAATSCGVDHPILLAVEADAGHGQGKPRSAQAAELADVMGFLWSHVAG